MVAEGNSSAGLIARYDIATDAFVQLQTNDYVDSIATNYDGTVTLANGGGRFYDVDMSPRGQVAECGSYGSAVNRAGTMGYGLRYDYDYKVAKVALCDPASLKATHISIGSAYAVGRLALSPDGTTLVGITDSGVLLFKP